MRMFWHVYPHAHQICYEVRDPWEKTTESIPFFNYRSCLFDLANTSVKLFLFLSKGRPHENCSSSNSYGALHNNTGYFLSSLESLMEKQVR